MKYMIEETYQQKQRACTLRSLMVPTSVLAVLMALSVFEPLEELCISLQSTSQTVSRMSSAVNKVIDFLENCRSEESFAALFTNATNVITKLKLNEMRVPRERKVARRKDSGNQAYRAPSVEDHFRKKYFKVIDMALQQLTWLFSS